MHAKLQPIKGYYRRIISLVLSVFFTLSLFVGCVTRLDDESAIGGDAKPLLWLVTAPSGQTMYLFGTTHEAPKNLYPLHDVVMDTFNSCDYLAVEVNVLDPNPGDIAAMDYSLLYRDGRTIADDIGEELYEKAKIALIELSRGSYDCLFDELDNYKLFVWMNAFYMLHSEENSMSAGSGVDLYLLKEAVERGMKVLEVESALYQTEIINNFSSPLQGVLLETYLDQKDYLKNMNDFYSIWSHGDLLGLEEFLLNSQDLFNDDELATEYWDSLVIQRNLNMVETAEKYMAEGKSVFFAVGALHMVGEDGIVNLLTQRGYDVVRIK